MATYKLSTESGVAYVSADLAQASAPIHVYFGTDPDYDTRGEPSDAEGFKWQPTPYQTADCRHREQNLAELVAEYYDMGAVFSID